MLFSDTKTNKIYRWDEGKGLFTLGKTIFAERSGCYTNETHCNFYNEVGSNGLLQISIDSSYNTKNPSAVDILLCQHGERAVGLLKDNMERSLIATHYKSRRFNSPNDLVLSSEGNLYFTDPPYGLFVDSSKLPSVDQANDPAKAGDTSMKIIGRELPFNGIYMINASSLKAALTTGSI